MSVAQSAYKQGAIERHQSQREIKRGCGIEIDREICVTVVPVPVPVSGQQTAVDKDKTS